MFCSCGAGEKDSRDSKYTEISTSGQDQASISAGQELLAENENSFIAGDSSNSSFAEDSANNPISEEGTYYSKDDVSAYLYAYKKLPSNYVTKAEAKKLGWDGGSIEAYSEGKAIGGDRFGNYEGLLPVGEKYFECDIDTLGKDSRGAKRIIYTEDCEYVYYTEDHYKSFSLIEPVR